MVCLFVTKGRPSPRGKPQPHTKRPRAARPKLLQVASNVLQDLAGRGVDVGDLEVMAAIEVPRARGTPAQRTTLAGKRGARNCSLRFSPHQVKYDFRTT